jgi:hypothetical protein
VDEKILAAELGVNASQIRQSARVLGLILRLDPARQRENKAARVDAFADPFARRVFGSAAAARGARLVVMPERLRRQGCMEQRALRARSGERGNTAGRSTTTMILIELLFGMMLAAFVLLMLPFFLVMAGIAGVLFLWIFADGFGLAVLVVALLIGLFWLDRRTRHRAY